MPRVKTEEQKHPENFFHGPAGQIRDRIIIHEAEDIPKEGLFISLNGYPFLCKPGVAIDIPRPVRLMLDTRITRVTKHDENGKEYTKDVKRINYTLVKEGVNIEEKVEVPPPNAATNTARSEAKEL
jgi:hypothetical protein